jgi:hypothetical protein
MMSIVALLNTVSTFLFGLLHSAVKWLGPFWSLVVISGLGGILLVWMFGKVSNQAAIEKTRNRLSSELIGLRLFKDDLRIFFGIQFQVLVWTVKYLRHSLVPMLILMVPALIILIQLNLHYGARPLRVGERALVKVKLRNSQALSSGANLTLQAPNNLKIETDGVRAEELKEVAWRVRGASPGSFALTLTDGKETVTKQMVVGARPEGVSTLRTGESWLTSLLYPGEAPIGKQSMIESVEIRYPELEIMVFGKHINWVIIFLLLSLVVGFAFKGVLGVKI